MGKDGFVWWQGVVEDRHDPLFLGRCRVRILGFHTENTTQMPSETLPWAYPIQPITSAAQTGVGTSPTGPVEGTWVIGFFRDGEAAQEPVFFGTLGGIPDIPAPNPFRSKGFQDVRVTKAEIAANPDHPFLESSFRLLDAGTDIDDKIKVPRAPARIKHYSQGTTANTTTNFTNVELKPSVGGLGFKSKLGQTIIVEEHTTRSRYPDINYLGEPTTPRAARGLYGNFPTTSPLSGFGLIKQKSNWRDALTADGFPVAENNIDKWHEPKPDAIYGARYPYNHVHQSESGHLIEVDDTPGYERLHRYHRMGTFEEIGSLGQRIVKVMNEDFSVKMMNDYEKVVGNQIKNIGGKLDVTSGNYFHSSKAFSVRNPKSATSFTSSMFSVSAPNDIILNAGSGGTITLKGGSFIKDFKTSQNSDRVDGDSTVKVGGKYSLQSGSLQMASRGSAGISSGGGINFVAADNIQESALNLAGIVGVPARSFKAGLGGIEFETALPGLGNAFTFNAGLAGLLGSISIDNIGQISLNVGPGGSVAKLTLSATGIELSYLSGLSKLTLGPAGADLSGLTTNVTGTVQAKVTGALTNVEASGINTVKGSLVMIN